MHRTLSDFFDVVRAAFGFLPFMVPPGYLFAYATGLAGFRRRSLPERLLWACSLSTPLAILIAVFSGRHLSMAATSILALCLLAAWALLMGYEALRGQLTRRKEWDRPAITIAACMLLLALYCVLATLGITVGHKLYEGTYMGDWSVRVPLTAAALRHGVPITTPFYGIGGASFPMRYYYYWYVLCGAAGRLVHASGRTALAASSLWSALALFSTLFLSGKYLFAPLPEDRTRAWPMRRLCVLMLPVAGILGLDILPSLFSITMHPLRLFPEMEWWRSAGDFAISFHTAILYAPHHTAGLVACMLGYLLLTLGARRDGAEEVPWGTVLLYAATAAMCFAAAVGTSTYLTVIFSIACSLLAMERAMARDWKSVAAIALTGAIALPLASTYIHEILSGTGASLHSNDPHAGHAKFIAVFPRNVKLPRIELLQLGVRLHYYGGSSRWIQFLLRPMLTLLLYVMELGFFGFVLAWRMRVDLRRPKLLDAERRMQWVLVAALGFAAVFLTSEPVIGVNDLGRHAGLALRFVAVLWATPLLARAMADREWSLLRHRTLMRWVYASILLGLSSQLWQVGVQRSYFWLVDRGTVVHPFAPFPRLIHYGTRYFETREAFEAVNRFVAPDERVQFNPASTYWTLMTDYLERPAAAFDVECEAAFGGDLDRCRAAMPSIRGLFGGGIPLSGRAQDFDPAGITNDAFEKVCAEHHLKAMIATASDRVWPEKQSWLWTRKAMFSNASMRVIACPKTPSGMAGSEVEKQLK